MYKLLIVDDEKMIRMGMKAALPWTQLEIQEVFTAASGIDALKIIKEHSPDIMITDIQMTEMTGLQLIETAREIKPELRVIVLTGYDNFEYARQSLRLSVQEFFLKPIEEEDLAAAIKAQVTYLEELKKEEKNSSLIQRTQGMVQQTELEHYMRNLVHLREDKEAIVNAIQKEYHLDISVKIKIVLLIATVRVDSQSMDGYFQRISVKNICMDLIDTREKGITFSDDDDTIAIAFFENQDESSVREDLEELADLIKTEFDIKPKMVVGGTVNGFGSLAVSYNDAQYLLEHEKEGIRQIVQDYGVETKGELFRDIFMELKGVMCTNVGNTEYVMKVYNTFTKAAESYNLSKLLTRRCCFELASAVYFAYLEDSGEVGEGSLDELSKNLVYTSREETCEVTRMFLSKLLGAGEENVHDIVSKAKMYIDEHLTEDLSVSSIAEQLFVTPNYFSRLFKRITGEGCNEYIVRKRIERAKSLLESTSIKAGKIAMMVGYRDTNYFSLAFKKHTGKSPTKYREDIQKA
ncbi:MAG: response regulator [Lachnospiraceae bacterium]|nr:response regulator [Lachnospiraceae bacterium]